MALHRPPIIANRIEVVLLILMCFIIATRLIWIQIDDRNQGITDEFYSTSLVFKSALGSSCRAGIDPMFPYPEQSREHTYDSEALTSPGLAAAMWGLCQFRRLNVDAAISMSPHLITSIAFTVAVTSRILTSTWVGGLIAAGVVLSRGSILNATHIAGSLPFLQCVACIGFLTFALYARTRDERFLPLMFTICSLCIFIAPLFVFLAWPLAIITMVRAARQAKATFISSGKFQSHVLSAGAALFVFPAMIFILYKITPSSTRAVAIVIKQFLNVISSHETLSQVLGAAIAELEKQDFHWQSSLAIIALAATWRRFLPRGSGFWATTFIVLSIVGLLTDGAIIATAARQSSHLSLRRVYAMTSGVSVLEPLIIGVAASYAWFAVRSLIMSIFPGYSEPARRHVTMELTGNIKPEDQNLNQ